MIAPLPNLAAHSQDNTQAINDIQRSLVSIAAAWHANLEHAAINHLP